MPRAAPIYVEIRIRGDMKTLWERTQNPLLHQQWDVRFTDIEYLPRPDLEQPQKFLYATHIGFGLRVDGEGESVGEHRGSSVRVSSLRFWSNNWKSLILEGSGYWKYVATDDGIQFLTLYDYRTRFGLLGRLIDRFVFRPLIGWATAWSFDRLRLWIEQGVDPASSMGRSVVHAACRTTLAFIWIYQGLVPKLIFGETSGELETLRTSGIFPGSEKYVLNTAGAIEMLLGFLMVALWRTGWLLPLNIVILMLLGTAAAIVEPSLLVRQFNPVTLNLAMVVLAAIGWRASRNLPTASVCLRRHQESIP